MVGSVRNQFSLDIHDHHLRVALTDRRMTKTSGTNGWNWTNTNVNRVVVLGTEGGDLVEVGSVGDIAPSEVIMSVRFVGDRGYVVTYRRVDPLFVIDLSDHRNPVVVGELGDIPGFSEYMHPLDENHLLTIGQDQGDVLLQIFDVTDSTRPTQTSTHRFSNTTYGHSDAQNNHKAFTYYASRKLLAFPYYWNPSGFRDVRSSLELFDVDIASGISRCGSIDHSDLFSSGISSSPYWCIP